MVTAGVEGGHEGNGHAGEWVVHNKRLSRRLKEVGGEEGSDSSPLGVGGVSSEP